MIQLYIYQQTFIDNISRALISNKHVLGFAPCGFGKSYCIASIAERAYKKGLKVLILSHRIILLRQTNGALHEFGNKMITINDHGKNMDFKHHLYCSTLQTLQSRMKDPEFVEFVKTFGLILIDEAHIQFSNFLFESGIADDKMVIGLTGSPDRSGNMRQLGLDYDIIVPSVPVEELIELKRLVRLRYFEVPMDISGLEVDRMTGDFTPKSQYQKFDNPKTYKGMILNYKLHGEGRKFVCFCANISHCIKTCIEFNAQGISAKFVVSTLNKPKEPKEKDTGEYQRYLDHLKTYTLLQQNKHLHLKQSDVNKEFDAGIIQGVVCIEVLSTGWDYRPLSCEILNRATQSRQLLIQIYGRIQRPYPGKENGIILDMGTNVARLGEAEKEVKWSLWHETNDSVGIPPEKICPGTETKKCSKSILASYEYCPFCGHKFATKDELREVELIERLKEAPDDYKLMSAKELKDLAELKHWPIRKVFHILWGRGESEFRNGMRELGYKNGYIYRMQDQYSKKR